MTISKRSFLAGATAAVLVRPFGSVERAWAGTSEGWRTFEVNTRVDLPGNAATSVWIPLASHRDESWVTPVDTKWNGNADYAEVVQTGPYGAKLLHATWVGPTSAPWIETVDVVKTRSRSSATDGSAKLSDADRKLYTAATDLIPTDGIVRETATSIVGSASTDVEKARAVYEWVVDNTYREASVRGCGVGDIVAMLKTRHMGGKCADLNALYVGLVRSLGIPARDLYGVRTATSAQGYRSLGVADGAATKGQHCRAEVFLADRGWMAVDPADVRKLILEEAPGNLDLADPRVKSTRTALFGNWDGNWIPYNAAHDVALPGSKSKPVEFLMYPQAEIAGERIDCLDPERFRYTLKSREIAA